MGAYLILKERFGSFSEHMELYDLVSKGLREIEGGGLLNGLTIQQAFDTLNEYSIHN